MTTGPTDGKSTAAAGGPGGMPAALRLNEGLGPTPPLAARLRSACSGDDEWRVQDPKDGSYCIAFNWREVMNPERMAREWLADHCRRFPGGLHTDFVVACVRVHTEKDKLMLEAAVEIERLAELADSEGTRAVDYLRRARAAEAQLDSVRKACGEAVDAASSPRTMSACGLGAPIGGVTSPWDDGYKNGVQVCATVVWAAMQPKMGEA